MEIRRLIAGLLLGCVVGCVAGCSTHEAAVKHYVQGQMALDRGALAEALKELSKAIEENPELGQAWLARGMLMKQEGDYQKSATDLEHAAKLDPKSFDANYQLGVVYQYLQRFREAVDAYQEAVEVRPLNPDVNMNMAVVYTQMGEKLRALPYAKRAVEGDPNSPFTNANLGILYSQLARSDDAVEFLRRSIDQNSKQTEVYVALANEYLRRGSFEQAKNVLTAAMHIKADAGVEERLGLAWYKLGDLDKAMASYQAALVIQKDYVPAITGLGVMHMERALKSDPADAAEIRQALALWRQSLALNGDQPKVREFLEQYKSFE
jgi:tetratricopeptide (TPR) repeat protein